MLVGELVGRQVDVARGIESDLPARDLCLAGLVAEGAEVVAEVNPHFRDVAAGPYVAAALATGLEDSDGSLRGRCREAWLFDPDYFELAAPVALTRLAGVSPPTPVETSR